MKKLVILLLMIMLLSAIGCGGDDGGAGQATDRVVIGDYDLPVYPGATTEAEVGMSATYTTGDEPDKVKSWYDEAMREEDWSTNQEWSDLQGAQQKIFFQGEQLENPDFGDRNVIITIGPNEGGGSSITLAPILNRYQG